MCSGGGGGCERNLGKKNGLWCCSEVDEKGAETASGDKSCGGGGSMEVIGCSDFYLFLLCMFVVNNTRLRDGD